jgi:hypothetical protein
MARRAAGHGHPRPSDPRDRRKKALTKVWCELVAVAGELTAWMQILALDGTARTWDPKRLRLFSAAGRIARSGRRTRLCLATTWPWATQLISATIRLQALAPG